ncbi:P2Y purinoceptor 4-like [Petromyzon marinus]|uniref:P2Y purinoceptor 4 n=1 Tax=Petromyzon marinus TaxID=7757 RepID=A0AAJ7U3X5_PETMA|nr:P2Y purinoceptor 4-like [Petromyzon marinus]XP_032827822.1 P2Y purinoceptor 4-like [Petromyzon marinus]XP_032827824.1 P2Y purinoceptor 4-like [Petromyzon marinus]
MSVGNGSDAAAGGSLYDDNCTFDEEFKYILLPVSYSLVFVLGLVLNCLSLWMFIFKIRPWTPATVFMCNLSVCDTVYVVSLPLLVHYYANRNNWVFGEFMCKAVRFLFYSNLYGSIAFLTVISLHRYLGVCHPIRSLSWRKNSRARVVSAVTWLVVIAHMAPVLFFVSTSRWGNETICHDTAKPELFDNFVAYNHVLFVTLFALPFSVILVSYVAIIRTLRRSATSGVRTWTAYKRRSLRMIVLVLAVFAVCFVPFNVTRTAYYVLRQQEAACATLNAINMAYKMTRPLASVNSCLDPILYLLAGDLYRRSVTRANAARCTRPGGSEPSRVKKSSSSDGEEKKAKAMEAEKGQEKAKEMPSLEGGPAGGAGWVVERGANGGANGTRGQPHFNSRVSTVSTVDGNFM